MADTVWPQSPLITMFIQIRIYPVNLLSLHNDNSTHCWVSKIIAKVRFFQWSSCFIDSTYLYPCTDRLADNGDGISRVAFVWKFWLMVSLLSTGFSSVVQVHFSCNLKVAKTFLQFCWLKTIIEQQVSKSHRSLGFLAQYEVSCQFSLQVNCFSGE